jgi:hypothetical protein
MAQERIFEIIKWVLIVFIAGFIGYFGKHLGKLIINIFRRKEPNVKTIIHKHESPDKYKAKIEKKRLKLEKKKLKKKK